MNKLTELTTYDFKYLQNFGSFADLKKQVNNRYPREFLNGDYDSFKKFIDKITINKPLIYLFHLDSFKFLTISEQKNLLKISNKLKSDEGIILFESKCLTHYRLVNNSSNLQIEFIISINTKFPTFYGKVIFENNGMHEIISYKVGDFKPNDINDEKEFLLNFSESILFFNLYAEFMTSNINPLTPNKKLKSPAGILRNKLNDTVLIPNIDSFLQIISERNISDSQSKMISFEFDEFNQIIKHEIINNDEKSI